MHHSFDINVASEYGIAEAIIIHHFQHWIRHNKSLKRNFIEGRTWSYQTLDEIAAWFPYLSASQIQDLLAKLCSGKGRKSKKEELDFEPVLIKGNFNKNPYDRTLWYAFVDEPKWTLGIPKMDEGNSQNPDLEIPKSIDTDTKPNTKTNIKPPPPIASSSEETPTSSAGGGGSSFSLKKEDLLLGDWTYKNARGEAVSISQTRIFQHFIRLSFPTEIVMEALKQARQSNELIGDPWRYLEAICFRLTQENKPKIEKTKREIPLPKNTAPRIGFFECAEKLKREAEEKKQKKDKENE